MHLTRRGLAAVLLLGLTSVAGAGHRARIVWDAGTVSGREVFTRKAGRKRTRLRTGRIDEDVTLLSLSPGGRRMACLVTPPGVFTRSDLLVAKVSKGRGRRVMETFSGQVLDARWTTGGRRLVLLHRASGRVDVCTVNAKGKGLATLTAGLAGSAVEGPGRTLAAGTDQGAVIWALPDRRELHLLDLVAGGAPRAAGLPEGDSGGLLHFVARDALLVTWVRSGRSSPDLYRVREGKAEFILAGIAAAVPIASGALVLEGKRGVHVVLADRVESYAPPAEVASVRAGPGGAPLVVGTSEPVRALLLGPGPSEATDLLPGHALDELERILFAGEVIVLSVREEGRRRLFLVDPALPAVTEPASGLSGTIGAFLDVSFDGDLVLFTVISGDGSRGELFAWSLGDRTLTSLTGLSGVAGIPGGAISSPGTGDVLFNTVTVPDGANRLFLFRRVRRKVEAVSDPAHRPGKYLFSR